jgi:hypothetical protein
LVEKPRRLNIDHLGPVETLEAVQQGVALVVWMAAGREIENAHGSSTDLLLTF